MKNLQITQGIPWHDQVASTFGGNAVQLFSNVRGVWYWVQPGVNIYSNLLTSCPFSLNDVVFIRGITNKISLRGKYLIWGPTLSHTRL